MNAAAKLLLSGDIKWAKGLTYDDLEERSEIDRGQIVRDFGGKQALVDALIDHCLLPPAPETVTEHEFLSQGSDWVPTNDFDLASAVIELGETAPRRAGRLHNEAAIRALASDSPTAAARLRDLYRFREPDFNGLAQGFASAMEERGFARREGLTPEEVVVLARATLDGLALRGQVDPEAITPGLAGRAMLALAEAAIARPDEDGSVPPLGARLQHPSDPV